jgi:hypothetical protein
MKYVLNIKAWWKTFSFKVWWRALHWRFVPVTMEFGSNEGIDMEVLSLTMKSILTGRTYFSFTLFSISLNNAYQYIEFFNGAIGHYATSLNPNYRTHKYVLRAPITGSEIHLGNVLEPLLTKIGLIKYRHVVLSKGNRPSDVIKELEFKGSYWNRLVITCPPGIYKEEAFLLPDYVHMRGASEETKD